MKKTSGVKSEDRGGHDVVLHDQYTDRENLLVFSEKGVSCSVLLMSYCLYR